jgi:polyhydroxyalkanoate synthesis regulator phasin
MPERSLWTRYVEAGMAFTDMTRSRAEAIVRDLVKAGEVQRERAQDTVDELIDRSRRSTEALISLIRNEIREQLSSLGLTRAAARTRSAAAKTAGAAKRRTTKAPATRTAKSARAKASGGTKRTVKKATAKKAGAKKSGVKKTTAKKPATKKTAGKKSAGKKAASATKRAR